jgi:Asp/Glu/hydantoin racemase
MQLFDPLELTSQGPRVALIHAQSVVVDPITAAFRLWPEARIFNILDDSLGVDIQRNGAIDDTMTERFRALARYAHLAGADAILVTTAAFGQAVTACRADVPIPVLRPTEAMIEEALDRGERIGLLTTFEHAHRSIQEEVVSAAERRGKRVSVTARCVPDALRALIERESVEDHDRLIVDAAAAMTDIDVLMLGQITMARTAPLIALEASCPVLSSPESAARMARSLVMGET